MIKYLYIVLGLISLGLGLLGIITPGLPTTPFILLTAFLFARSSPKLYNKLLNNKLTGRYLRKVNEGLGLKGMLISIGFMWCMVCFTAFVVFDGTMRYVMLGLGVVGTFSQIIVLSKRRRQAKVLKLESDCEGENELKAS
ncbi:MAG: YbaN family protein [Dysgonomonas sp.]|nr:YbaN family protein [Dysgonomonas sp.]